MLWHTSSIERVRKCGRVAVQDGGVVLKQTPDRARGYWSGVATCGSIWACPCCSGKIRNHRADEVSRATAGWDRAGNDVYMATFTAPHDLGMALQPLLSAISDAFRYCLSGRAWQRLRKRLGIAGQIRSLEVTHGEHGWHPHLHVLIYVDGTLDAAQLAELLLHLRERWNAWITGAGYRAPHALHGVDLQRCESAEEAGRYVAKTQDGKAVGNELARGDMKLGRRGSRTPFQILDDFRWTGDAQDLALWGEYERATKGRQAITWSKGLRDLLLEDEDDEKTDDEVAAEEVGGEEIAAFDPEAWKAIVRTPGIPVHLLERFEHGGLDGLTAAVTELGLRRTGASGVPTFTT